MDDMGVRLYDGARWSYLKLLEKRRFFDDKEQNSSGYVMRFFETGELAENVNKMLVCLIPKGITGVAGLKVDVSKALNTQEEDEVVICDILGVHQVDKSCKYLGMPMSMGKSKTEVIGFLQDRMKQKLHTWQAGEVDSLKKALFSEELWRVGVRDLRSFKLSMLAKQGWGILNESNPLVSAIMKAKYDPNTSFLNANMGRNPSFVWRSIMAATEVVKAGTRRKIKNGLCINVWSVPWLSNVENGLFTTSLPDQLSDFLVNGFMNSEERKWDMDVINNVCNSRDVELTKRIPIYKCDTRDSW
ncbi:hypothetical protein AgCh_029525 [Apium graveolens]